MGVRLSDLPKDVQAKIVGPPKAKKGMARAKSRAGIREADPCPYRCSCGDEFPSFGGKAGWEAHSKATGHLRGAIVL